MFPTLDEVIQEHKKILEVKTINGFRLSQKYLIKNKYSITAKLNLPQLHFFIKTDKDGKQEMDRSKRTLQINSTIPFSYGEFSFGIQDSISSLLTIKPNENIGLRSSLTISKDLSVQTKNTIFFRDELLSTDFFKQSQIYSIKLCTGKLPYMVGGQFIYDSNTDNFGFNVILSRNLKANKSQVVYLYDKDIQCVAIKYQKDLFWKYNWKIASAFQFTFPFSAYATISWKTNINNCVVHSSVSTLGIVKSSFETKPNKFCTLRVTAELDHAKYNYNTGFSLSFNKN